MYETLESTATARVATVALNRPEVRNAFDETLIAELTARVRGAWTSDDACAWSCWPARGKSFSRRRRPQLDEARGRLPLRGEPAPTRAALARDAAHARLPAQADDRARSMAPAIARRHRAWSPPATSRSPPSERSSAISEVRLGIIAGRDQPVRDCAPSASAQARR